MKPQGYVPKDAPAAAHERKEIDVRLVTRIGVVIVLTLVVLLVALVGLFHVFNLAHPKRGSEAAPQVTEGQLPPQPRVEIHPARDLQQVRAQEDAHLNRYAWVDRSRGIAQIPIERAMVLWLQINSANSAKAPAAMTNSPPAGETELQVRQQKAQENSHVP